MSDYSDGKFVYKKEMLKYKGAELYKFYNEKILTKKIDL